MADHPISTTILQGVCMEVHFKQRSAWFKGPQLGSIAILYWAGCGFSAISQMGGLIAGCM